MAQWRLKAQKGYQWVVGCPGAVESQRCTEEPSNSTSNQQAIPCTTQGLPAVQLQFFQASIVFLQQIKHQLCVRAAVLPCMSDWVLGPYADCFDETRLVLQVPSSSRHGKHFIIIVTVLTGWPVMTHRSANAAKGQSASSSSWGGGKEPKQMRGHCGDLSVELTNLQLEGDGELSQLWLGHAAKVKGFAGTVRHNHAWVNCIHNNLEQQSTYQHDAEDCSRMYQEVMAEKEEIAQVC